MFHCTAGCGTAAARQCAAGCGNAASRLERKYASAATHCAFQDAEVLPPSTQLGATHLLSAAQRDSAVPGRAASASRSNADTPAVHSQCKAEVQGAPQGVTGALPGGAISPWAGHSDGVKGGALLGGAMAPRAGHSDGASGGMNGADSGNLAAGPCASADPGIKFRTGAKVGACVKV